MSRWRRDQDPKLGQLAELALFAPCSPIELAAIGRLTEKTMVPARTLLCKEGGRRRDWYAIRAGSAVVTQGGVPTGLFGPGDWWGEAAILGRASGTFSVEALAPMAVIVAGQRQFVAMLDAVPGLAQRIQRAMGCWAPPYARSDSTTRRVTSTL